MKAILAILFLGAIMTTDAAEKSWLSTSKDDAGFTIGAPMVQPGDLVFYAGAEEVLRFHADGTVTSSPKLKADESARAVIEAIKKFWPPH